MLRMLMDKLRVLRDPVGYWRGQGMRIGEGCEINPTAAFGSEPYLITLGNHVRVTQDVKFVTHDGGVWVLRGMAEELAEADCFGPITVGDNVHIGMHAIILPGVTIGSNSVIGAGAVVTKDVPEGSVAAGVPARVIRSIGEYAGRLRPSLDMTKSMSPEEKKAYLTKKYGL